MNPDFMVKLTQHAMIGDSLESLSPITDQALLADMQKWMGESISKQMNTIFTTAMGLDLDGGYDPDRRDMPAVLLQPILDHEIETKSDEWLEATIHQYDADKQAEAKIRITCKRELRRRQHERHMAEQERMQAENPMYALF